MGDVVKSPYPIFLRGNFKGNDAGSWESMHMIDLEESRQVCARCPHASCSPLHGDLGIG